MCVSSKTFYTLSGQRPSLKSWAIGLSECLNEDDTDALEEALDYSIRMEYK